MAPHGETVSIHDDTWSKAYRYTVANGIKMVMMKLNKHISSHMNIAGHRILASYDGQPVTLRVWGHWTYVTNRPQKARRRSGDIRPARQYMGPCRRQRFTQTRRHWRESKVIHQGAPTDQTSGCPPLVDELVNTYAPISTSMEQNDTAQPRRHALKPQEQDTSPPTVQPTLIPLTW